MPKPLAEIAIEAGLVSREDVANAARRADRDEIPLVVAMVRQFDLDELALVAAIRRRMRVPLSDPGTVKLDPEALREVSREVCRRLRVLPLSISVYGGGPRLMRVAVADPTDHVAIAEIEHLTGCRVEVSLMPLSAVEEMVEKGYRAFVTEVMKRGPGGTPSAIGDRTHKVTIDAKPVDSDAPSTIPFHRISDEAHLTLRHQALLELLVEKNVISEDEYEERVRQLMKGRDEDG